MKTSRPYDVDKRSPGTDGNDDSPREIPAVRKPKVRVPLSVEAVESRNAPSGLVPVLTMFTLNSVAADVHRVMGTLAKNHNFVQAGQRLNALSSRIPFGRRDLAPAWQSDLASVSRAVPGSGLAAQTQMVRDLYQDVLQGVQSGAFRVTGRGSEVFYSHGLGSPPVASSVASVNVRNNTGFSITVTAFLNSGNPRPSITRTIPSNTAAPFDFGTNNNAFIALNVMQTNNPQSPPPLVNYTLNRPVSGYNGATFTVSVFAGYFSIGS